MQLVSDCGVVHYDLKIYTSCFVIPRNFNIFNIINTGDNFLNVVIKNSLVVEFDNII